MDSQSLIYISYAFGIIAAIISALVSKKLNSNQMNRIHSLSSQIEELANVLIPRSSSTTVTPQEDNRDLNEPTSIEITQPEEVDPNDFIELKPYYNKILKKTEFLYAPNTARSEVPPLNLTNNPYNEI